MRLVALVFTLFSALAFGFDSPGPRAHWDDIVQPRTYTSADGQVELSVQSEERDWRSAGHYVCRRGEEVLWERKLPYTLWNAAVTSTGTMVGYGYQETDGSSWALRLLIVTAEGDVLLEERIPDEAGVVGLTVNVTPLAREFWIQEELDRMVVETGVVKGQSRLRCYALSTGERLEDWTLRSPKVEIGNGWRLGRVQPLPGTGLVLANWWTYAPKRVEEEGYPYVVTLTGQDGRIVWQFGEPYRQEGAEEARWPESHRVVVEPGGRFAIEWTTEGIRLPFVAREASASGDSWSVQAQPREILPRVPNGWGAFPRYEPKLLRSFPLKTPPQPPRQEQDQEPLDDILAFGLLESGELTVLRESEDSLVHLRIDRNGKRLQSLPLGTLPFKSDYHVYWQAWTQDSWLAVVPGHEGQWLYRVQLHPWQVSPVMKDPDYSFTFHALSNGGWVMVDEDSGILVFDAQELLVWEHKLDNEDSFWTYLSTPGPPGSVILLGQEEDERWVVRIVSEPGQAIQTIQIPESMQEVLWSSVVEDGASGVWLGEGDVLVRLGPSGEVLAQHEAHLADGSCFPVAPWLFCVVQRSQDGLLWSANDHVIASIDAAGKPGPLVGQRIPPIDTRGAYALGVDRLGRIWVQHEDLRTTSWFDSQGKFLFRDSLPTTTEAYHPASCEVDSEGRIWWKTGNFGTYYVLQADGTPLGLRHSGPRFGGVRFAAGVGQTWACDETSVFRLDAKGEPTGRITKRPDGCWWRDITGWDVSEDGKQLAVVDTLRAGAIGEGCLIAILDTTSGDSRFLDIPISGGFYSPPREVQLAGDWLLVGGCLIHVPTLQGVLLTLAEKEKSVPIWQLDPEGTHLIRLSWQEPLSVQIFALPEFD